MSNGNPRGYDYGALWVARLNCAERRVFPVLLAILAFSFGFGGAVYPQGVRRDVSEAESALDIAEVESFRYFEPEADLLLDEGGERKRKALVLFYRGICLEGSDMSAALEHFKQVIGLDPSNVGLAMETAMHCAVYGKFSEALAILERSLEQNPGSRDAIINISRYCDTHHNKDEELEAKALAYAEQAYEKFPLDPVVIEYLITLLVTRDEDARAEELLEKALAQEVGDGDYWLAMGAIAQQVWPMDKEGNLERVFAVFETALRADPGNLQMVEKVAQFYRLAGNPGRAIQLYTALVQLSPELLGARRELAELHWEAGDAAMAVAGLEALVRIDPEAADVRRTLAAYYQQMGQLDRAMAQLEEVLKQGEVEVEDFIRLAELQLAGDKVGGALQTLRRGGASFPESPRLAYFLAMVYLDLERYADAYPVFGEAEVLAGSAMPILLTERFYFQYGMAAERVGKIERAEELFRKSIGLVADDAEEEKAKSLNYLGYMLLERAEKIDEAGEMIGRANELKPDNGAYLDSLGWFNYLKGDYDKAVEHLLRAAELMESDSDSVVFEHLARSYFAKGDKRKALRYLERALEIEPDRPELHALGERFEEGAAGGKPQQDGESAGSSAGEGDGS